MIIPAKRMSELSQKYLKFDIDSVNPWYCDKCGSSVSDYWLGIDHLILCLNELKEQVKKTCECGSDIFIELKKYDQCAACGKIMRR